MMWTGSGLRSPNIPPSPNISTLLHSSINLVLIDLDQEEDQNHRKQRKREFLAIQWLGRSAFTAVGPGSVPDWATKISQALWCSQKNTKYKKQTKKRIYVEIRKFHKETPRSQLLSYMPATSGFTSSSPLHLLSLTLFFRVPLSLARTLNREAHSWSPPQVQVRRAVFEGSTKVLFIE